MSTDLKDILDQETDRLPEDEPKAETPEDTSEAKVEDAEIGATEAETVEATPEPGPPKEEPGEESKPDTSQTVPRARLNEEVSKRRALEEQLRQLQGQAERPKAPDVFDNQDAYNSYVESLAEQKARSHALDVAEAIVRDAHGDDVVEAAYEALQAADPADQMRVRGARSPWHELVKWHKERKAMSEIGDPDSYRERVRQELRAELEAEMAAKQVREKPAPAPSLATETSVGRRGGGWSGPTDLSEIIG